MSTKFKNKYRIDSARLKGWDYSNNAAYFVTICTRNREHFFGKISSGIMSASILGDIVEQEWLTSVALRPDMNLSLGEYVVMPNHFHGIIFIGQNEFKTYTNKKEMDDRIDNDTRRDAMHGVSINQNTDLGVSIDQNTDRGVSIDQNTGRGVSIVQNTDGGVCGGKAAMHGVSTNTGNAFGPQSKNLGSIMRGFKSAVTTFARKNNLPFDWQSRFHDHIVRNEIEYKLISDYIINNPAQWSEDKFYS